MSNTELQGQAARYLAERRYDQALALFEQAIEADPTLMSNYWHLGLALLLQGLELDAQMRWASALAEGSPEQVAIWTRELVAMLTLEALRQEAAANLPMAWALRQYIREFEPENLGNLLQTMVLAAQLEILLPDHESVLAETAQILQSKPVKACEPELLFRALERVLRFDQNSPIILAWIQACLTYSALVSDHAGLHNALGIALWGQGRIPEAFACYHRALQIQPDCAEAHTNLGNLLRVQGELESAVHHQREALQLRPDSVEVQINLGLALREQGQITEAIATYQKALQLQPDCLEAHAGLAALYLLAGDFEQGWAEYEWRWREPKFATPIPEFQQRFWDGSPLKGRQILLHTEQGLGDAIQFCRYAPLVKQQGGTVILECHEPLKRLLASCEGIDQIISRNQALPHFEIHAPLMSLPHLLTTRLDSIPQTVPYLKASAEPTDPLAALLNSPPNQLKVGLVWAGSAVPEARRSCPFSAFEPLLQLSGVSYCSLQKGPALAQLAAYQTQGSILELGSHFQDFADTAYAISQLDLVISVDTAVAHLAGALAKPTWVLLPFAPDWRWLLGRDDTPWYPTMRLFRQAKPRDWLSVLAQVAEALERKILEFRV